MSLGSLAGRKKVRLRLSISFGTSTRSPYLSTSTRQSDPSIQNGSSTSTTASVLDSCTAYGCCRHLAYIGSPSNSRVNVSPGVALVSVMSILVRICVCIVSTGQF